jgi:hypothetical protein
MDGRTLRRYFQECNEKYFSSKLPAYSIRTTGHVSSLGESGRTDRKNRIIWVFSPDDQLGVLLHEMAHAAVASNHGPRWRHEMGRLRSMGAPLTPRDGESGPAPLTRDAFESAAREVLSDSSEMTYAQFVKYFGRDYGHDVASIKRFKKRYPWTLSAFAEATAQCKREADIIAQFRLRSGR